MQDGFQPERLMEQALDHYRSGQLQEAEAIYRRILDRFPEHSGALQMLAGIEYQRGNAEHALDLMRRAVDSNPGDVSCHFNLAIIAAGLGRPDEARRAYEAILAIDPSHARAWNNMGNLLARGKNLGEAMACYRKAIAIDDGYAEPYANMGRISEGKGRADEAVTYYRRAMQLRPAHATYHSALANLLVKLGEHDEACRLYRQAVELEPENPRHLLDLGSACREAGMVDEARVAYERAITLDPTLAPARYGLGLLCQMTGDIETACRHLRAAIDLEPELVEAHYALAKLVRHRQGDGEVRAMERLLAKEGLGTGQKVLLHFALARVYDDLGDYERAFSNLYEGNTLHRTTYSYDIEEESVRFRSVMEVFSEEFFRERADWGVNEVGPVFILGMPRSGSTLVEQILSGHTGVRAGGELHALRLAVLTSDPLLTPDNYPQGVSGLQRSTIRRFAQVYLRHIAHLHRDGVLVTDKMPVNFIYLGMIHLMFPRARIVHVSRDPAATCFSCYQHHFSGIQSFAYDLVELGRYYRLYQALMCHWRQVLPASRIHELRYERLIEDPEGEVRALLDYCGLPWEEACLRFHRVRRNVATASAAQVRQPLFRRAISHWRHYEGHLQPLLEALGEGSSG